MIQLLMLFLSLLFWHTLADYPLQGDFLAKAKAGLFPAVMPWWLALVMHAYIHAFGVLVITGNLWGGLIELVAHTTIDYLKARRDLFGIPVDQLLHVVTKMVIIAVLRVRFV